MNAINIIDSINEQFAQAKIDIKDIGFMTDQNRITISIPNQNKKPQTYTINAPFTQDKRQKLIDLIMTEYVAKKSSNKKAAFN